MRDGLQTAVSSTDFSLEERGETFAVTSVVRNWFSSHTRRRTVDYALQLADERMYARKKGSDSPARESRPTTSSSRSSVPTSLICRRAPTESRGSRSPVGRRLGLAGEQLDELARAAALHDVGKVGLPEAILDQARPARFRGMELRPPAHRAWANVLSAAPALRPVASHRARQPRALGR